MTSLSRVAARRFDAVATRHCADESSSGRSVLVPCEDALDVEDVAERSELNAALLGAAANRRGSRIGSRKVAAGDGRGGARPLESEFHGIEGGQRACVVRITAREP